MRKTVVWVVEAVSLGALLLGCSGNQETPTVTQSADFLFTDPHSSGPRLDVLALGDDGISVSVGGPIGSQTDSLLSASAESLSDLYRLLHPEVASVPEELLQLERDLAPQLKALGAERAVDPVAAEELPRPSIEKSQASFLATVCKTFVGGQTQWVASECNYKSSTLSMVAGTPNNIVPGDRSYGWNDVGGTAMLCWFTPSGGTTDSCIVLPQYWWNWQSLSTGGPYYASLASNSFPQLSGPRGLTHHRVQVIH